MKQQIGVRMPRLLWQSYRELCAKAKVRPQEPLEAFLKACVGKGNINTVLSALRRAENAGQAAASELRLKIQLLEMRNLFEKDRKTGGAARYRDIINSLERLSFAIQEVSNESLIKEAEKLTEEIFAYYGQKIGSLKTEKEEWGFIEMEETEETEQRIEDINDILRRIKQNASLLKRGKLKDEEEADRAGKTSAAKDDGRILK